MKTITQFLISFGIILISLSVISLGNKPVLAVVLLIAIFVLSAIFLILMGINFIGITYIILYVGAIAVLFLFVIMMLNLKDKDLIETSPLSLINLIYSSIIAFFFAIITYSLNLFSFENFNQDFNNNNQIVSYNNIINDDIENNLTSDIIENNTLIQVDTKISDFTQIESLGQDLYTYGAVLLISLSIILLLAMFATIIISKENAKDPLNKN